MSTPHMCPLCMSTKRSPTLSDEPCDICDGTGIVWEPGEGVAQPVYEHPYWMKGWTASPDPYVAIEYNPEYETHSA